MADCFCHITFPVSRGSFFLIHRLVRKTEIPSFLTQFFSHSELRELQKRRRFCHITFRAWHEKGRLSDADDQKTFPPVAWKGYVSKCACFASQLSRCSE